MFQDMPIARVMLCRRKVTPEDVERAKRTYDQYVGPRLDAASSEGEKK